MIQKRWARVEFDKDGTIFSCTEVSSKGRQGALVRYFECEGATTEDALADACRQAKEWATSYRERQRADTRRQQRALLDAGLCVVCRSNPRVNANHCDSCRAKHNARAKELRGGAEPLIKKVSDLVLREHVQAEQRASKRRQREKWGSDRAYNRSLDLKHLDRLGADAYREYLCGRIRKAGGGPALDEYERERAKQTPHAEAAE